jgi:hypothetical protein
MPMSESFMRQLIDDTRRLNSRERKQLIDFMFSEYTTKELMQFRAVLRELADSLHTTD